MPDIKDELDALFDDDKPAGNEGDAEKEAEEQDSTQGTGAQTPGKKTPVAGARTSATAVGRKLGAKTLPRTQAPSAKTRAPEPEETTEPAEPTHAVRPKVVHAPSGGGKALPMASLVLNIVLLLLVALCLLQIGNLKSDNAGIRNELKATMNAARVKLSVFVDRGDVQNAALIIIPEDPTKLETDSKVLVFPLEKLRKK